MKKEVIEILLNPLITPQVKENLIKQWLQNRMNQFMTSGQQ